MNTAAQSHADYCFYSTRICRRAWGSALTPNSWQNRKMHKKPSCSALRTSTRHQASSPTARKARTLSRQGS